MAIVSTDRQSVEEARRDMLFFKRRLEYHRRRPETRAFYREALERALERLEQAEAAELAR